jgi:hypothetical protein
MKPSRVLATGGFYVLTNLNIKGTLMSLSATQKVASALQEIQRLISANLKDGPSDGWVARNNQLMQLYRSTAPGLVHLLNKNGMEVREIAQGMGIPEDEVIDILCRKWTRELGVGAIVQPKSESDPLRSGGEAYAAAVVISMEPFVMTSHDADMRWGTWTPDRVEVIGMATEELLATCMRRLEK